MGKEVVGAGAEAGLRYFENVEGPEEPVTVYRRRVWLAPGLEFEGVVSYHRGHWEAVVMVDDVEVLRRGDIWSFQAAKIRVDHQFNQVYMKFLGWLNQRLFENR